MRSRRITISGASGQLGAALAAILAATDEVDAWGHGDVDITQWSTVRDRIAQTRPHLVIHAAAATNVDRCETDSEWAWRTNALGTRHVAQAAAAVDAELIYISTNYVFDGSKASAYHEFDTPNPISVYGASKLAGEQEVISASQRCKIVRTAWLYSATGNNFVNTMRRLMTENGSVSVVNDQYGNPTSAVDLAQAITRIAAIAPYGTYHTVNAGVATWYDWAVAVAQATRCTAEIVPIPGATYHRAATPPVNGELVSLALPALGISLPTWQDALEGVLQS